MYMTPSPQSMLHWHARDKFKEAYEGKLLG